MKQRFEELRQLFLKGKIYFPDTTDLVEELDYLESKEGNQI